MSISILSDSTQSGNSNFASIGLPVRKNKNQILQDWIEDTGYVIQALQIWLVSLKVWQYQDKVSSEDFEKTYAVICDATLSDWARVGIVELRAALTRE
jgi:hypothetical protein